LNNSVPIPIRQSSLKGNRRPSSISSSNTFQSKISKFSEIFFYFFLSTLFVSQKARKYNFSKGFQLLNKVIYFLFY
jgi:hypothetical protein